MAEKQEEALLYRKEIKLPASLGDWTSYKPVKPASKRIKPLFHSFRRISKYSLEKTLLVHHFFTHDLAVFLKDALKASIDVYTITLEQLTYIEYLKRVAGGIMYNKISLKGIGEVSMVIDFQLANLIINFSLGCQSVETKLKDLTDVEESILKSIFDKVLEKYAACWGNVFEKPGFEIISYPNVQRESHINLNEVITVVTAQMSVANSVPATIAFVYQNSVLRNLYELLKKKEDASPLNVRSLPEKLLSIIDVPVMARLGKTDVSAKELAGIENDDVISLDQKLNEPIGLFLGNASLVKSQPGIFDGRVTVRILGGGTTKIMNAPKVVHEETAEAGTVEEGLSAASEPQSEVAVTPPGITTEMPVPGTTVAEEDFELPLEEEDKEEYNQSQENIFEEDDSRELGGK